MKVANALVLMRWKFLLQKQKKSNQIAKEIKQATQIDLPGHEHFSLSEILDEL